MEEDDPNPNPTSNPTTATNPKHQAMLERLANHQTRSRSEPESEPGPESVSSFLSLFSASKLSVESDLARCRLHPPSDPKPEIDRISASISDLEQTLARNSYFLPSYELRSSLHSISELKQTLEILNNDLIPKKKFSFKNRNKSNPNPNPNPSKKDQAELITKQDTKIVIEEEQVSKKSSPGFRNRKGEILVKNFRVSGEGHGEFTLAELDSCEVYLKGRIRALFINRIKNCRIFCGPVSSSILIEDVSSCLFILASHQIRIHEARGTDFYLRVRSRPIIEDSSGVRFGPYRFSYEGVEEELRGSGLGEETGNWANVDDFKWLRAVQSPNWCVIPDEERVDVVNALDLEEKCGNE